MVEGRDVSFRASFRPVPTLFRFLAIVGILAGLVFGGMFALATFVEPQPREMTVTIPNTRLAR